jgi:nucleolar protein 56
LKTRGKTPKYGLIFNSTFIGRAGLKNKGRISRYLANKCAIAARLDSFTEGNPTGKFGETLKAQMEERLNFLSTGAKPRKNKDAMNEVLDELKGEGLYYVAPTTNGDKNGKEKKRDKKADEKKKKVVESSDSESESEVEVKKKDKKKEAKKEEKKEKKDKKKKKESSSDEESEVELIKPKKKKQKTD